ncbi:MAG TPA: OmpA family protein [Pyrinomonadaceae bacterium]|jgi:outer membrane protein OmpA-like peptidoglycan-associated protein|nr:OmpA family protein [Pyrinomonadaceae bacterium]
MSNVSSRVKFIGLTFALALALAPTAFAQAGGSTTTNTSSANSRTVASGQKMTIKGVVTKREADSFTVQDANGVETNVLLNDRTSVKTKGGFLRSGTNYGVTAILRGLNLEVEGVGDSSGNLVADKIRFNDSDLRTARAVTSNVVPVENRVGAAENRIGQVEQNSQRLSGQLDELAAVSNAARGGAKAAQETADAAVSGVNATNERISALDDYQVQNNTSILFKVGSAVLLPDSKQKLDQVAQQALNAKGYVLEVSGFASSDGSTEANRRLSQRRADAVIRYLVENHQIPLRRIITPYGYGASNPVADNTTREGREQNRRVEVKVLVNRGLIQGAPQMNRPSQNPNPGSSE